MDARGVPLAGYATHDQQYANPLGQHPPHAAQPAVMAAPTWPPPLNTSLSIAASTSTSSAGGQHSALVSPYEEPPPDSATSAFTASSFDLRDASPSFSQASSEPTPSASASKDAPSSSEEPSNGTRDKSKKRKKPRERVQLATDQPLTSQGKERQRVYLACAQCRQRKIRCDGAKPGCEVCVKRGITGCNYDTAPKRRGPDRQPGGRQRLREEDQEADEVGPVRTRRRRRPEEPLSPQDGPPFPNYEPYSGYDTDQLETPTTQPPIMDGYPILLPANPVAQSMDRQGMPPLDPYSYGTEAMAYGNLTNMGTYVDPTSTSIVRQAYITEEDEAEQHQQSILHGYGLASEPAMDFIRDTWWDNLIGMYISNSGTSPTHQLVPRAMMMTREVAIHSVTADIRFLFRHSNHWLNFFHIRTFLDTLLDPRRRARMQPALVFSALALSALLQSSEVGRGLAGRETAFTLRDAAQGALDASVAAGWIDDGLAQAALLLAVFEVCGHIRHTNQRARDAMVVLDGIIRSLALTELDRNDPNVTTYAPPAALPAARHHAMAPGRHDLRKDFYGAPRTPPAIRHNEQPPLPDPRHLHYQLNTHQHQHQRDMVAGPSHSNHPSRLSHPSHPSRSSHVHGMCNCQSLSLAMQNPNATDQSPMWAAMSGWNDDWDEGQVRKEACRRLCWSALGLAAGHTSYASAITGTGLDLTITNPANFAIFFNGEAMSRSVTLPGSQAGKETVWALYNRLMLLWHSCLRLRVDASLAYADKAQLAMAAWLELDAIEAELDTHTCGTERAFMFQGREIIFNTRMVISYEYQKFIPEAMTNFNGFFHRAKAEEWLRRQYELATGMMQNYGDLTGLHHNMLTYRPFFAFWFMAQVSRCLMLWRVDPNLTMALEVAEMWLPPIDYLVRVWPSEGTRKPYNELRQQLTDACAMAGRRLPSFAAPIPAVNQRHM